MKRKITITCLIIGLLFASIPVQASTLRSAEDCEARITLYAREGVFSLEEHNIPLSPTTPKRVDGSYKCVDINGYYSTQKVSASLNAGQISEKKYAPDHFRSHSGRMAYYLNGSYAGTIQKYY